MTGGKGAYNNSGAATVIGFSGGLMPDITHLIGLDDDYNYLTELYGGGTKVFTTQVDGVQPIGALYDKDDEKGTAGQILSSTGTALDWIDNPAIVTTSVTWTASAGSIHNIDSIAVGSCSAIEYTIFVSNGSNIQSQKVLIMDNGTTAYIQEYAVMSNPNLIVTFTADVSSGNVRLRATPETGISGSTTTKFTKILIV